MSLHRYAIETLRVVAWLILSAPAQAVLTISSVDTPVVITFESTVNGVNNSEFRGQGFDPDPIAGELDSDAWEVVAGAQTMPFGGSAGPPVELFANDDSDGNATLAGIYSFHTGGGNRTLGVQPHVDHFTPGSITLRVLNNTGASVSTWSVAYDVFAFNDTNASTSVDFSYGTDPTMPATFVTVAVLDFDSEPFSPVIPAWSSAPKTTTINITVAANTQFYLRWTINSTGGTSFVHDEIGLDNISVTAVAVPEPSAVFLGGVVSAVLLATAIVRRIIL